MSAARARAVAAAKGKRVGNKLRSVPQWRAATGKSESQRDVLEYGEAMTATPPAVTDELVDRLRQNLSPGQLAELTYLIGVENQRSRVNFAMGLTRFKETYGSGG